MNFDIAIIGGGPAGYTAAERAGANGLRAVLFEKKAIGGVCPVSYTHLTLPTTPYV